LLDGLHTPRKAQKATLRMLGHWLMGSRWVEYLVQAGVATPGVADSFLSASHVKRSRYANTVTISALNSNSHSCYTKSVRIILKIICQHLDRGEPTARSRQSSITGVQYGNLSCSYCHLFDLCTRATFHCMLMPYIKWSLDFCCRPDQLCTLVTCSH
jgi:hypothetical protein